MSMVPVRVPHKCINFDPSLSITSSALVFGVFYELVFLVVVLVKVRENLYDDDISICPSLSTDIERWRPSSQNCVFFPLSENSYINSLYSYERSELEDKAYFRK